MSQEQSDVGFRPNTYAQLRTMTKDQMIAIFDSLSPRSRPGGVGFNDPNVWLAEIHRLDQEQINQSMLRLTKWVTAMTVIITVATVSMFWTTLK